GGVAFGFAGCVEVWAIFPVIVLACMFLLRRPRIKRLAVYLGGVAAGFLVPPLPFAGLAPKRFYESLYVAQVAPRAGSARVPLGVRLSNMIGVINLHLGAHPLTLIEVLTGLLIVAVAVLIAAGWLLSHRPPPQLDWFVLATTAVVVVMFLWPDQFHYHFAAFLAPFFALSVALPLSRLLDALSQGSGWLSATDGRRLRIPAPALGRPAVGGGGLEPDSNQ